MRVLGLACALGVSAAAGAAEAQSSPRRGESPRDRSETTGEADDEEEERAPLPSPDREIAPSMAAGRQARAEEARGFEEPPGDEPEDYALAVPRMVLALPRAVALTALAPVRGTLYLVDRHHLIERIKAIFYNEEETAAILPVLTFGGDQGFTVGVDAFHSGLGRHDETISLSGRWGGQYTQAYDVAFDADSAAGTRLWVESIARYEAEPNLWFYGYGPGDEVEDPPPGSFGPRDIHSETQFRQERVLGLLRLGYTFGEPGGLVQIGGTGIYNNQEFAPSPDEDESSIEDVYDTSRIAGFDDGVEHAELTADLVVDTRDREGATSRGLYLHAFGGGVPPQNGWRFGHYGVEATGYIDLYRGDRILVLRAVHEAVVGQEDAIPFSDLPRLGGTRRLRGFRLHRFRDETAAVATIEYHYPIHEILAGTLFLDAGHVASRYRDLVDVRDWRLGGGGGFIIRSEDSMLLNIEAAYGEGIQLLVTTDPLRAFEDRGESL